MTPTVANSDVAAALQSSRGALRRIAEYSLEPAIAARLSELSEGKEFLTESEHRELLGLVEFTERRTIEKLEALAALAEIDRAVRSYSPAK